MHSIIITKKIINNFLGSHGSKKFKNNIILLTPLTFEKGDQILLFFQMNDQIEMLHKLLFIT